MTDMQGWPTDDEGAGRAGGGTAQAFADIETDERGYPTEAAMREALKAVMDPEIGIDVVNLGLVYEVTAEDGKAFVRMTLTTMGCPLTELIHQQVTLVLTRLPGIEEADVEFVFSPPWSTDMISEEAKEELRAMGFNV
ncbi:MAG: metal-sulfur cluster assembly factor [Actinomycetota bacterium]